MTHQPGKIRGKVEVEVEVEAFFPPLPPLKIDCAFRARLQLPYLTSEWLSRSADHDSGSPIFSYRP